MVVPAGRRESAETQTERYSAETKPEDSSDMQRPCSGFAASRWLWMLLRTVPLRCMSRKGQGTGAVQYFAILRVCAHGLSVLLYMLYISISLSGCIGCHHIGMTTASGFPQLWRLSDCLAKAPLLSIKLTNEMKLPGAGVQKCRLSCLRTTSR